MSTSTTAPRGSTERGKRALGTVTRAGKALDLFTPQQPVWGATSLAHELGVAKSQAHQMLISLSEIGLLRRESGGRYRLGWRTLALGRDMLRSQFPDGALQPLRHLALRYQEPVVLMTFDRDQLTVVLRQGSNNETDRLVPSGGLDGYAHCCAMAKCLVADLPDAERLGILGRAPRRFTAATIVDLEKVLTELDQVRAAGIAFDYGEIHPGLRAVAAPLTDLNGDTIAAVGVWTTARRWERLGPELTTAVVEARRRIEAVVRGTGRAGALGERAFRVGQSVL